MKTLNKFVKHQLSKHEMNYIKGGDIECYMQYVAADGHTITEKGIIIEADTIGEAAVAIADKYASIGYRLEGIKCV